MKKMDEMEMYINMQSTRIAWAYMIIFLLVWVICDYVQTSRLGWPFFLLITENLVVAITKIALKSKMEGEDEKQD